MNLEEKVNACCDILLNGIKNSIKIKVPNNDDLALLSDGLNDAYGFLDKIGEEHINEMRKYVGLYIKERFNNNFFQGDIERASAFSWEFIKFFFLFKMFNMGIAEDVMKEFKNV